MVLQRVLTEHLKGLRGGQKGILPHAERKVSGGKNTEIVRSGEESRVFFFLFSFFVNQEVGAQRIPREEGEAVVGPKLSVQESLSAGLPPRKVTGHFTDQRRR